jgi:hypothetical protein
MARFGGELVEQIPTSRFGGEEVSAPAPFTDVEPPKKEKTPTERLKQFGEAGLGGTLMGAAAQQRSTIAHNRADLKLRMLAPTRARSTLNTE